MTKHLKGYQLMKEKTSQIIYNPSEACILGRHVKRTFSWFTSLAGSDSQKILIKRKVEICGSNDKKTYCTVANLLLLGIKIGL